MTLKVEEIESYVRLLIDLHKKDLKECKEKKLADRHPEYVYIKGKLDNSIRILAWIRGIKI